VEPRSAATAGHHPRQGAPVTDNPAIRGGIEGYPTGLTWYQHHRVARVVASASTDATDCALLLAALGIHPADGVEVSDPRQDAALGAEESGVRRKRKSARWTRD
jgi:hypothetical protein